MPKYLVLLFAALVLSASVWSETPLDAKHLGVIFNNDINNILHASTGKDITIEEYRCAVNRILDLAPGVLAQNVGMPDPVIYRSKVATTWDKYHAQVTKAVWPETPPEDAERQAAAMRRLLELGTDPLAITVQSCRERGVPIVASFRMNAEDFYGGELDLSDFDRAHKDLRIPGRDCLDPAQPEVYKHRMDIFAEVANDYDIDGIEFDFRRWYFMISNPLENYPILTQLVADTRKMLDEIAARKGKPKMLLGVRVGPMLEGPFNKEDFPGAYYPEPANQSCRNLGLDVKTWVDRRLVDYICPALFSPIGLPRTKEFADLVKDAPIGVYPTISYTPRWAHYDGPTVPDSEETRLRHLSDICAEAAQCYGEGADGVSLFNWFPHCAPPIGGEEAGWSRKHEWPEGYRPDARGFNWVEQYVLPMLARPDRLRAQLTGEFPQALKLKKHAIEIIAHRGANRLAPENTQASAQKCIDLGVDYLEVDSLLSKDHVHYNLHDFTLSRTTNGKGLLSAAPSSIVDTLDAGSWFGPEFAGERVPRLDTFVPWLKGKIKINFDVKFADLDVLIKLIRDTHFEQECFLHFASPVMALRCHALAPDLVLKVDVGTPEEAATAATVYRASIVETQLASLTPAFRETLQKYGLKVILCAEKNDEEEYRRIIAAKPDMVMLDAPDLFLKVLGETQ